MSDLREPGIPRVTKGNLTDDFIEWQPVWFCDYPDLPEWGCCRQTEFRWFATWREAIRFALSREWERDGH